MIALLIWFNFGSVVDTITLSTPAYAVASDGTDVWVNDGGLLKPIRVQIGLTDGLHTEVIKTLNDDKLTEGDKLVTGENAPGTTANGEVKNPFAPPPIFGRKKQ